jgi:hypothetical protein
MPQGGANVHFQPLRIAIASVLASLFLRHVSAPRKGLPPVASGAIMKRK